jgi:hypothetical protein
MGKLLKTTEVTSKQVVCAVLPTLAAVALAPRLYLAWQDVPTLIARLNADDFYYYLTIARHLSLGHGATFDGLGPTNGFHPVYTLLLAAIFHLWPDSPDLGVHLALSLLSLCNVLTAWPLYGIGRQIAGPRAGLAVALCWLFNPWTMLITLTGVEAAVYALLAGSTVWAYLRSRAAMGVASWPLGVLTGLLAGLTILARSEGILLLGVITLDLLWQSWNGLRHGHGWRTDVGWLGLCLAVATLTILPWLAWNLANLGTVVQVSGAAIMYNYHYEVTTLVALARMLARVVGKFILRSGVFGFQLFALGLLVALAVVATGKRGRTAWQEALSAARPLGFVAVYGLLVAGWYVLIFWQLQHWYFIAMLLSLTIFVAPAWRALEVLMSGANGFLRRWLLPALAIFLVVSFVAGVAAFWPRGFYPPQAGGYRLAQWLAQNTPTEARIGAWNSGIIGYFSHRTVINLDGVVNNRVYTYVQARHATVLLDGIVDYLRQEGIDYVTDYEDLLSNQPEQRWPDVLELIYQFPGTHIRVYGVRAN